MDLVVRGLAQIADLELLFDQLLEQRDETFRSLDNDGDGEITSEEMAAMRAMVRWLP